MDDFFSNDDFDFLSDFTADKKAEKRPPEYNAESRKKKVENFVLQIDEFSDKPAHEEKKHETVASNRPQTKGEVYFANYQKNSGASAQPRYTQQRPQQAVKRQNPVNDLDMFSDSGERHRPPQDKPVSKPQPTKKKKARRRLSEEELKKLRDTYSRTFYIAMVCVLVLTVTLSTIGIQCINDALALSVSDQEIEVTISDGITTSEAVDIFKEKGLINVKWFSVLFAKFRGYDDDGIHYYVNGEERLQPYVGGTYYLSSSMGIEGMLNIILDNS